MFFVWFLVKNVNFKDRANVRSGVFWGIFFDICSKNNDFNILYNQHYISMLYVLTYFFLNFFAFNMPKL